MEGTDERARIARELQDVVAHAVSVMTVQTAAVRRVLRDDQEREREALEAVERTGRAALAELRRLADVVRAEGAPPDLSPTPGLAQIQALVDHVRADGVEVDVAIDGDPRPLAAGVDVCAYRIVEEALADTTERATVTLRFDERSLELEVANDGAGEGLAGVRERVSVCAGSLEAGPRADGRGYVLRATLPVESAP